MTTEQYRKTPRAKFLDYNNGDYFITICTGNRKHYFGEISNGEMILNNIGEYTFRQLEKAKSFNNAIDVPVFIVMPNHIHAIVCILNATTPDYISQRAPNPSFRANPTCRRHVPTLSRYINSFKGAVVKYAHSIGEEFCWQSRYHDHKIRGINDGNNIAEYILNNASRWESDCFND